MLCRVYKSPSTGALSTPVCENEVARIRILEAAGWYVVDILNDAGASQPQHEVTDDKSIMPTEQSVPEDTAEAPEAILGALYGKKIASALIAEGIMSREAVIAHQDDELEDMGFTPAQISKMRKVG